MQTKTITIGLLLFTVAALLLLLPASSSAAHSHSSLRRLENADADASATRTVRQPRFCIGLLGNGLKLGAHYGGIARMVETYGTSDCASGGSSGSTTIMAIESVYVNPAAHMCHGATSCSDQDEQDLWSRQALLFKSMSELFDTNGIVEQSWRLAFYTLDILIEELLAIDIQNLFRTNPFMALIQSVRILLSAAPVINTNILNLILNSPDPVFHAQDILFTAITEGTAEGGRPNYTPAMIVRPGLINTESLAEIVSQSYTWYAGYNEDIYDAEGTAAWMDACGRVSRGLDWEQTKVLPGSIAGTTCGEEFGILYNTYQRAFRAGFHRTRADDDVGMHSPMFVNTAVLTGFSVEEYNRAEIEYYQAETVTFSPLWSDVKYGYFGMQVDIDVVAERLPILYPDSPTANKFVHLGQQTWRFAISRSIAEPNLSDGLKWDWEQSTGETISLVSVGGWVGIGMQIPKCLDPTHSVSLTTKSRGFPDYVFSITQYLGATDEIVQNDMWREYNTALSTSDGIWCTRWNGLGDPIGFRTMKILFDYSYNAPLGTQDKYFLSKDYPNTMPFISEGGCIPLDPIYISTGEFIGNATQVLLSLYPNITVPENFTFEAV